MYEISKLENLKKLGLKKSHIKLLTFFLKNVGSEFKVREISKRTEIPLSRIYPYLNDLHMMRLIDKKTDKKAFFYIVDPETRFRRFLNQKDFEIKELQRNLLDNLSEFYTSQNFVTIKTSEEFYQTVYQIVKNIKILKVFARTPAMIFLEKNAHYWKKQVIDLYRKKIIKRGFELYYLVDENFFRDKPIKKNRDIVIKNIKWLNDQKNVHLRSINGTNIVSIILTEKEIIIGFRSPAERRIARALLFRSNELLNFFENFYDNIFDKGKEVIPNII